MRRCCINEPSWSISGRDSFAAAISGTDPFRRSSWHPVKHTVVGKLQKSERNIVVVIGSTACMCSIEVAPTSVPSAREMPVALLNFDSPFTLARISWGVLLLAFFCKQQACHQSWREVNPSVSQCRWSVVVPHVSLHT